MQHFPQPVFVAAGLRTPFGRGGGALANHDAISLSVPVVKAMAARAENRYMTQDLPDNRACPPAQTFCR